MWVFLNNAFLSIVEHRDNKDILLVRSRFAEDINRVFPKAEVFSDIGTDYKYRAFICRDDVSHMMKQQAEKINYTNFKNSVLEMDRHNTYLNVWQEMWKAQQIKER